MWHAFLIAVSYIFYLPNTNGIGYRLKPVLVRDPRNIEQRKRAESAIGSSSNCIDLGLENPIE